MDADPTPRSRRGRPSGGRDAIVIALAVVAVFLVGVSFNVFDRIDVFRRGNAPIAPDDVLAIATLCAIGLGVFAIRRSRAVDRETKLRQEAEDRYRTIVERVPAVAYVWDSAFEPGSAPVAYISPQIEGLLGYSAEQWTENPQLWAERAHPEDADEILERWADAVEARSAFVGEYRMFAADGREVWIRDEAVPVGDGEHGMSMYQGVMFDITVTKRTEEQLRKTEERYRTLVEHMPVVSYVSAAWEGDQALSPRYVAPGIESLIGYTAAEWLDDPNIWGRALHPDDHDAVFAEFERCATDGRPFDMVYRLIRKDGRTVWVRDQAVIIERGEGIWGSSWQGAFQDITEQKEAEGRELAARDLFKTLVEQLPVVVYTSSGMDEPGIRYIAPGIEVLTGYTADEWISQPDLWERLIHPGDRERVLGESRRSEDAGSPFAAEYRLVRKDGRVVWVRDTARIIDGSASGKRLWQGVLEDVTEQRGAEDLLRAAESQFRTLVEQLPAVTYAEDPVTGDDIYISPQIETMFGYTQEEWLADPDLWADRLHPDDRDWVVAENEADTGDNWSVDYRTYAKDGRLLWVHNEAVLIRDENGEPRFWQGVVFDITERKRSEERLREAEARYRSLVEQMPAVVYVDAVDDRSTALYISPQYEKLMGYTAEERMHDPDLWVRALHPEDRDRVLAESLRTNETGDPFDIEYRLIRKDGEVVWVRDHAVMVGAREGHAVWQGVLSDITERKLASAALSLRDRILEAAGFAAERFLLAASSFDVIDEVLQRLGGVIGASRAYLFENELDADRRLLMTQRFEWTAPDVSATIHEDYSSAFPYVDGGYERWMRSLGAGDVVHGLVRDFPESERSYLEDEGIRSMVIVPVRVAGEWWGFVGFDQCDAERDWQPSEIEALRVVANTLGAAIGREYAERRLSETEARYRTLVEQIPAITYIVDATSKRAVYMSPQLETVLGYTREEWGPTSYRDTLHPDDRDRVLAEDARTDETHEPFRVEFRARAKDGRWVWIRDEAVLVRDERGNPLYWQGVRFDITAQKEAEGQLRDAESRYRTLIETIPAATYIDTVQDVSKAIYMSPQVEELFGYTPEEWLADPELWEQHLHPDDHNEALARVEALNRDGTPYEAEYRFRRKDGSWKWIRDQAVLIRDERGEPIFAQGFMFDITDRMEAVAQLREAEERFRGIVEHVPAAIYLDVPDGSMDTTYVSPQIEAIWGLSPDEYVADPNIWLDLMDPQDQRDEMHETYVRAIEERRSWAAEYRIRRPDGRIVWVHDETTFVHDQEGGPLFLQGVMYDVTERKLAEEALRESERRERDAAERLRALDDMKNTFLAAVSHELRSPLTSILGLSLTLERQDALSAEDRSDLLDRLAANARKLDRLLKDLLDIDRLNRGIVSPQYRVTDIGALASRTVESLDSLAGRRVFAEIQPIVVTVDPAKVERIVENLLVNAARHTGDEHSIWLRVAAAEGGVLIAVDDDGPGVPVELREAIFEPFRQGPTASKASPGTGIGLSLVARFAELHGGRAWVEARDGGGASFRVFIPSGPGSIGNGNGSGLASRDLADAG